ncbi:PrpF protein [Staphylococcus xylosus]|uniref:2-methylaconitate cis-trans isomerase PrpF family protein n=1 Tax=Staphylococcus xylosus TaxID=1288 RepID=UPI001C1E53E9|nr:PrpF domain-containing protein [Staphylococcus xylosus]MBU6132999.1 PrpF protein [Staphylococcus xylosus]MEB6290926.1 PrpF protein [Staphylococcus xylosus]MEB7384438.1 PrpF protein [Staphylococcus xylosus]MEB7720190.1 PrpF protein [Staphylococcus xylosus]MEB7822927.1 PrpF protein [Staphylococcus xylosus]
MNTTSLKIPCVLMRGGTSRGLIFKDTDLPIDEKLREEVILKIYGSSANGQIDGIGGGTSVTSKVAIVGMTDTNDSDIYYNFGQVGINQKSIDYNVTCGNMASAVGLYAVEEGLVKREDGETTVRILNTNTNKIMEVRVPVYQGEIKSVGDFSISGVEGTGAKITVSFIDSSGAFTGKLLPTGNLVDYIKMDETTYKVSILDTGNIVAFVKASDFSLEGFELAKDINERQTSTTIEKLRVKVGILLGLFSDEDNVNHELEALPKITLVSEPKDYITEQGSLIKKEDINIIGRYISMGKLHPAFAVSGSICLATACKIPGTVPADVCQKNTLNTIEIGHPSGTISSEVFIQKNESAYKLIKGGTGRTARRIMEGNAVIPISLMDGK